MIVAVYEKCWDRKYSATYYVDTDKIDTSDPAMALYLHAINVALNASHKSADIDDLLQSNAGKEVRRLIEEAEENDDDYGYFICNRDEFGSQSSDDICVDLPVTVEAEITIRYQ